MPILSSLLLEEPHGETIEDMEPIEGDELIYLGGVIPNIIERGRKLLEGRSRSEISFAQQVVDGMTYTYINEDLKIPHSDYIAVAHHELDALKGYLDNYEIEEYQEFQKGRDYEFAACLSLLTIDSCLYSFREAVKAPKSCREGLLLDSSFEAARSIGAMCYAEHLYEKSKLKEKITSEFKEEQKRKRSLKSKELNIKRHALNREAKTKVLEEWHKNRNEFPSAEKAGGHYATWLTEQGYKDYTPRTISEWIRSYAKDTGIKLR